MSQSLPPMPPAAQDSGSMPPLSAPSDSKSTSSELMRASLESSAVGSSSSTPSEPVPPVAKSPSDEASSSTLLALINSGLSHLHQLYEALVHLMEEGHEREMQQRETAHAQALRHKADLHAQKLRHREELYAKEREQAIQIRNIKEGECPADDEPYFSVQNDIGGFDRLTREEFNDFRDKTKDRWSKVSIREPVDGGLVGGNDFREEDHVWTGSPGTGSGAVVPDQGFGDAGSTSEEDAQNSHSKMKRGKEKEKQQAQVSPRDYLEKDG